MAKKQKETREEFFARMNNKFGSGSIKLGNAIEPNTGVIEHPSLGFNLASSIWGLPRGCIIQIEGDNHIGKSTFTQETIGAAQKSSLRCMLMDFEYSLDMTYAERLGINFNELIVSTPDTMEDAYNLIEEMLECDMIDVIVVDSVTQMIPRQVLEGEIGDAKVAPDARVHSVALKRIMPLLHKRNATLIGVSQYRAQVGSMSPNADKGLSGSNAWKFGTSFRIKLSRLLTKKEEGYFVNNVEITKNKKGTAFLKHKMYYTIDSGVDQVRELIEYGKEVGVIKQAGAWYSHGENKLGGGINAVKEFFADNPEYFEQVRAEVIEKLKS